MSAKMTSHKNSSTTFIWGTLPVKAIDFAILIYLIVFQNSQLNLLSLMLVLLGSGVRLLPFLSTTTKSQHKMKSGLLLNVVVRQSTSIFQLLASKDQSLLVRRNSFLILDLDLYIFYGIRGLDLRVMVFPIRVSTKICTLAVVPPQMADPKLLQVFLKYHSPLLLENRLVYTK